MRFKEFNANYWARYGRGDRGDCCVRALCVATLLGYRKVCELLGVPFVLGVGYGFQSGHGITADQVEDTMSEYVQRVYKDEQFYDTGYDLPPPDEDELLSNWSEQGLEFSLDMLRDRGQQFVPGRVLVFTRSPSVTKRTNLNSHATALLKAGSQWTCVDSEGVRKAIGNQIPTDMFIVRKTCPTDSPDFYPTERKAVLEEWRRYIESRKAGSRVDK